MQHELAVRSGEGTLRIVARERRQLTFDDVRADLDPEGVPAGVDRDGRFVVRDGHEDVVDGDRQVARGLRLRRAER